MEALDAPTAVLLVGTVGAAVLVGYSVMGCGKRSATPSRSDGDGRNGSKKKKKDAQKAARQQARRAREKKEATAMAAQRRVEKDDAKQARVAEQEARHLAKLAKGV